MRIFFPASMTVALLWNALLAPIQGQSVDELLLRLADNNAASQAAGTLATHTDDPRVVPALKEAFLESKDKTAKQSISLALIRSKVQDQVFFDYLALFAQEAVDDDAPIVYLLNGHELDFGNINPGFVAWCESKGITLSEGVMREQHLFQMDLMILALAQDKRSAPIFRKGLSSNNPFVVDASLAGLAALEDPSDIPAIIATAGLSPSNVDHSVETALAKYKSAQAKAEIENRLQGSRLYDGYIRAVKTFQARQKLAVEARKKQEK